MTIQVQKWSPSPDDERKQVLAAELLKELEDFGYTNPRSVYIRNFNLNDPEIDFFIVTADGTPGFRGCHLDLQGSPHCAWHGYGQSPPDALKEMVMARPYRLYPPPIGPAPADKR